MVGRELVQHLAIHSQDALLEDAGIRERALSLLSLKGLQLLLQGLWQVGFHIVSCSLGERGERWRDGEEVRREKKTQQELGVKDRYRWSTELFLLSMISDLFISS